MSQYWQIQTTQEDNTNQTGNATSDGYGQISVLLNNYVRKEKGKGLSTNDFTDNDKNKLDSIESGAEKNKVESVKVNGQNVIYPNSEKQIPLNIPNKTSQLKNDASYAKTYNASSQTDYSDSYVGKSLTSFEESETLSIGKNANATSEGIAIGENAQTNGGIAIGKNSQTDSNYDINIGNKLKHNAQTNVWSGKIEEASTANVGLYNSNGTPLTKLDTIDSDLSTEIYDRSQADLTLQQNINNEALTRSNADTELSNNINTVSSRVTTIENMIPSQASSENKLADKSFVNSSIQTNTSNFRGSWATWSDVPTSADDYPTDYSGSKTPTTNDYMIVQNASDYTEATLSGTWRFKYVGDWVTDGKSGWINEYQVNEEPLTSEQVYAINSGITSQKVTNYDNHLSNTNNPHSVTATQVGLGNVTNVSTIATVTEDSTSNITSGAVFTALGLKNDKITVSDNNIDLTDSDSILSVSAEGANPTAMKRSLLSAVWTYINSKINSVLGLNATKVGDYDSHLINTNNPHSVTATQVGLGNVTNVATESTITEDSTKNITSGAVFTALASKVDKTTEINGKALNGNVTLDYSDIGDYQTNDISHDGIVTAPTISHANQVWKTDANGNPAWRNESSASATFLDNPIICSTASATADKVVDSNGFILNKHCRCIIEFEYSNTATSALTLNINSTGAKTIILNGTITSANNYSLTSGLYNAYYDGTNWILDSTKDSYWSRHSGSISNHTLYI